MDVVFELLDESGHAYRVHADVVVVSTHDIQGQTCVKWDGIFTPKHTKKHRKYDALCTQGKDLFFACGSDILGNFSPEFNKLLSYLWTYVVRIRGIEDNSREKEKLRAIFHWFKTDVVFCHARCVGAAWRRHIARTLGAAQVAGEPLDADDLRFLKDTGHVDWFQLAA